ncbi:MAG: GNAT family N-acetyltransferase, partial [Verrucomicrobiota bacterium]
MEFPIPWSLMIGNVGLLVGYLVWRFWWSGDSENAPDIDLGPLRRCDLPDLAFRPYEPQDRSFCLRVNEEILGSELPADEAGYHRAFPDLLERECWSRMVITSNGEPVAFCGMTRLDSLAILHHLLVPRELRGRGLGSLGFALQLGMVRGLYSHVVSEDRTPAAGFYKRFGFLPMPKAFKEEVQLPESMPCLYAGWYGEITGPLTRFLKEHFSIPSPKGKVGGAGEFLILRMVAGLPRIRVNVFSRCNLPDLSYRDYQAGDREFCVRIHEELLSADLAPSTYNQSFLDMLDSEVPGRIVIASRGEPVAFAGITLDPVEPHHFTSFYYGLMPLNLRNRGLGSLSFALRLWLSLP